MAEPSSLAAYALVSSDDGQLSMGAYTTHGGVARALNEASGGVLHAETRKFIPVTDRYLETYWQRFPGVWVHGDWAAVDADGREVVTVEGLAGHAASARVRREQTC